MKCVFIPGILVVLSLFSPAAWGSKFYPPTTPRQLAALAIAAREAGVFDLTLTEQALIGKEDAYCAGGDGDDGVSLGCGQVQLATAGFITGHATTAHRLRHDDAYNIHVSVLYLNWCMARERSWARGLVCYNAGPAVADTTTEAQANRNPYVRDMRRWIRRIQELPRSTD